MRLEELNNLPEAEKAQLLTNCCGSSVWVKNMIEAFPFSSKEELIEKAESIWYQCFKADWLEAFTHHPKIGDVNSLKEKFASTAQWASGEQSGVNSASDDIIFALSQGNKDYEEKFGFIFIVCATGKTAKEMLEILQSRLPNHKEQELSIAMGEQNKITKIRIEKLLS